MNATMLLLIASIILLVPASSVYAQLPEILQPIPDYTNAELSEILDGALLWHMIYQEGVIFDGYAELPVNLDEFTNYDPVTVPDWMTAEDLSVIDWIKYPAELEHQIELKEYLDSLKEDREEYKDNNPPLPPTPPVTPMQPYPFPLPGPPIPFPTPEYPNDPDGLPGTGIPGEYKPPAFESDPDPDTKEGGKDPQVIREGWGYFEFDAYKCSNAPNSFDYDSDGFPEHMCYWYTPTTKIFFNDKYGNQTLIDGSQFLGTHTHLWQDKNSNVFIDDGELTPITDPHFNSVKKSKEGWVNPDNGRYEYCIMDSDFGNVVCTLPTYWGTQEWMKGELRVD